MLVICWSMSFPSGLCTWFSFPWQPGHTGVGRAGFVLVWSQVYLDCCQAIGRFTTLAGHRASFCPAPQTAPVTVCL